MLNYKAIIFDLDGVICSTDKYHYKAWKKIADEEGIYFDRTINNRLRGVSRTESLDIILERADRIYSPEEKSVLADKKNQLYRKYLLKLNKDDLSDGVEETLFELRNEGIKLAVGSSSRNAKLILSQLGIINMFDKISDGTNITKSKPDPEVFLKAASFLNMEPDECLVVEDAKAGILAAHKGGFDSAGIGEAAMSEFVNYRLTRFRDILNCLR